MEIIVYNPCPVRVLLSSILNHHKRDARAREIHKKDDPSAYALTKFSKYVMWILSLVGCVRPNNLVKNRFPLSDAPYSIGYSQSRKRRNFVHSYDGKLVSVRKS
jgi:hypothetical protein